MSPASKEQCKGNVIREFKTTSLADQVFEHLENDIIMGVYSIAEALTELNLVVQLRSSRTPICEVLRCLEQERLIEECIQCNRVSLHKRDFGTALKELKFWYICR